jgi:hypothetical protein
MVAVAAVAVLVAAVAEARVGEVREELQTERGVLTLAANSS